MYYVTGCTDVHHRNGQGQNSFNLLGPSSNMMKRNKNAHIDGTMFDIYFHINPYNVDMTLSRKLMVKNNVL